MLSANYRVTGPHCSFIKALQLKVRGMCGGQGDGGGAQRDSAYPASLSPTSPSTDMLALMGSDSVVAAHNQRRERGKKIAGLSNNLESEPLLGLSLTGSGRSLVAGALSRGMRRTLENRRLLQLREKKTLKRRLRSCECEHLVAKITRSQSSFLSSASSTLQWPNR